MNRTIPPAMERLLAHESEMGHPEPRRAVYLGLLMVFSAIREVALFPEGLAEFVDYSDDDLIRELTGDILLSKAEITVHGVAPHDHFDQLMIDELRRNWNEGGVDKRYRDAARSRAADLFEVMESGFSVAGKRKAKAKENITVWA